jgi:hypothetical protein
MTADLIKRYVYGWLMYARQMRMQWRKRHGAGRPPFAIMHFNASCGRWLVDGQHRRALICAAILGAIALAMTIGGWL